VQDEAAEIASGNEAGAARKEAGENRTESREKRINY